MRENKKRNMMLLVIITMITVNYQAAETATAQTVQIVDPNLSMCIEQTIGSSDGEITMGEMHSITSLDCEGYEISSIEGLEYAMHLDNLNLSNNKITDVSPLSSLVALTTLDLSDNQIVEISSLQTLTGLENLMLNNNMISDISALSQMPKLYHLELTNNNITDISGLEGLNGLHYLYLSGNQIADLSPISELSLISAIDVSNNQIADLSPLINYSPKVFIYANDQSLNYQDIVVNNDQSIDYTIVDLQGMRHTVEFNTLVPGENHVGLEWDYSTTNPNSIFTGSISQNIYYDVPSQLTGNSFHQVKEEKVYTDAELVDLFNVKSSKGEQITVDASNINFSMPGTYPLIFSDESGNVHDASLEIVDVLPQVYTMASKLYVPVDSNIDLSSAFEVSATEISNEDLNSEIVVDQSQVNFSKEGSYDVNFSVRDEEGNIASQSVKLIVFEDSFTVDSEEDGNGKSKVYVQKVDENGKGEGGYEYTIYDDKGKVVDVIVTDENGYAESKNLKDGNYTIVLTGTPDQSNIKDSDDKDKNDDGKDKNDDDRDGDSDIVITDLNNDENEINLDSSQTLKVDTDDQLIKNDEEKEQKSNNRNSQPQSSSSKPQSSTSHQMLAQGQPQLKQVSTTSSNQAPDLTADSEVLSVTEDTDYSKYQNVDNNQEPFQFEVVLENGASPVGIVFNVVDENGVVVQSIESDENGIITIDPLPVGKYKLELSVVNNDYVLENEVNISVDSENSLSEMPPQITLKEKHANYVAITGVGFIAILAVIKVLPRLIGLLG